MSSCQRIIAKPGKLDKQYIFKASNSHTNDVNSFKLWRFSPDGQIIWGDRRTTNTKWPSDFVNRMNYLILSLGKQ